MGIEREAARKEGGKFEYWLLIAALQGYGVPGGLPMAGNSGLQAVIAL